MYVWSVLLPPIMLVKQAGRLCVACRQEKFAIWRFCVVNVCCKWVLFERVILSVSISKGRQGYVTWKRFGWDTLLCCVCVCLPLPRTLHCSVFWTLNVFYLSCLCFPLAGELCFWCHKCQTLMELNSTRSYHASARARHCKWLQKGDLIWETTGACLQVEKKCSTSKMSEYSELSLCNS